MSILLSHINMILPKINFDNPTRLPFDESRGKHSGTA